MTTYEQKLAEFASGKRFRRLARPIRDRADGVCDACGSPQPRTLHMLKDELSNRYYAVGHTCLSALARRGVLVRRYSKESASEAYELEMNQRTLALNGNAHLAKDQSEDGLSGGSESSAPAAHTSPASAVQSLIPELICPMVLLLESPDYYEATVLLLGTRSGIHASGHSREARCDEAWEVGGGGELVLQKVKRWRPQAMSSCLATAWAEACSQLGVRSSVVQPSNESNAQQGTTTYHSRGAYLPPSVTIRKAVLATATSWDNG